MMLWIWLGAIVAFGAIEALTAGLVSIWFVVGAAAALLAAILGLGTLAQASVFIAVSAPARVLTRPLAKRITAAKATPTNADRILDQSAKVTETIDNENSTGAVYADGKTWTARSADGSVIPAGAQVHIERLEGVKLFVRPEEKMEVTV